MEEARCNFGFALALSPGMFFGTALDLLLPFTLLNLFLVFEEAEPVPPDLLPSGELR